MASDRLAAMRVFSAVVHEGSFAGAAKRMDLSTTAVSRHVAALEKSLGIRLLQRTTRRLQLTDVGREYLFGCDRILGQLKELEAGVHAASTMPSGRLRIAVQPVLAPLITTLVQYRETYPQVDLEVIRVNRPVDMVDEQFDLWIHAFGPIAAGHVAKPLMHMKLAVAASPEYLSRHGVPTHPRQLAKHRCLTTNVSRESNPWRFERDEETSTIEFRGGFVSNDAEVLMQMARAGAGIIRLPQIFLGDDLRTGMLRQILDGWGTLSSLQVSAVYPSARYVPAMVRTFLEMLTLSMKGTTSRQVRR
jgi:DNA-binding transcriptional LysR family regulator